jgi:ATP-binding cassette subfamily E protein 1
MYKKQGDFELEIEAGTFHNSQIVVMLGENGTGKTTFIKMLAGRSKEEAKEGSEFDIPEINVSYKPQTIAPKFQGTVR